MASVGSIRNGIAIPAIAPSGRRSAAMTDLFSREAMAEGLWQTANGMMLHSDEGHAAWLALAESEKQPWRDRATAAVANWRQWLGTVGKE
jgi:hypothetical protein